MHIPVYMRHYSFLYTWNAQVPESAHVINGQPLPKNCQSKKYACQSYQWISVAWNFSFWPRCLLCGPAQGPVQSPSQFCCAVPPRFLDREKQRDRSDSWLKKRPRKGNEEGQSMQLPTTGHLGELDGTCCMAVLWGFFFLFLFSHLCFNPCGQQSWGQNPTDPTLATLRLTNGSKELHSIDSTLPLADQLSGSDNMWNTEGVLVPPNFPFDFE